jgi:hypothetical protein
MQVDMFEGQLTGELLSLFEQQPPPPPPPQQQQHHNNKHMKSEK